MFFLLAVVVRRLTIVIFEATVVGMTAITIIPANTYGSIAVLPLALTMLTIANMTAGKKRNTKQLVNR